MLESLYKNSPHLLQRLFFNAYAWNVKRHRYGRAFEDVVREFTQHEGWTAEQIRDYQVERLRAVLRAAYEGSTYYRSALGRSRLLPEDIQEPSDLAELPLLTRDLVRENAGAMLTGARRRDWLLGHTSGTTGSPITLWYDRNTCITTNAVDRRQKAWAGMRPGDWTGLFFGRMVIAPARRCPPFWQVNIVQKQVWFSTYHMREAELHHYGEEIRRRGLRYLEGYPSTLYILAKWLLRRGEVIPMRAVFTSSETTHPAQREAMQAAFCCPVFDYYGLAERVAFATECEQHNGKHLADDFGYVEVVDEEGRAVPDGQLGYVVGTSLHNLAMPMIRYRTNDVSAIQSGTCECGRPFRRIRNVVSRREDMLITPDDRIISPLLVNYPIDVLPEILLSQMIQVQVNELLVKLVVTRNFSASDERSLVADLRQRIGDDIKIMIEYVADIPRERSGKFRWFISRVDHPYQVSWEEVPAA